MPSVRDEQIDVTGGVEGTGSYKEHQSRSVVPKAAATGRGVGQISGYPRICPESGPTISDDWSMATMSLPVMLHTCDRA